MTQPAAVLTAAVLALLGATTTVSAQTPAAAGPSADQVSYEYLIGPGDVLKLSIYRAPEFDSMLRVAGDGSIQVGTIGTLKVAGSTPAQVSRLIADRLIAAGIYKDPVVNILVAEYHNKTVSVFGAVTKPGEYPIDREGLTISEVLARAGASLDNGATRITVKNDRQPGLSGVFSLDDLVSGKANRRVTPGDTLLVQSAPLVYVSGEVVRPGSYPIMPGMTIRQAITLAGDVGPRGSRSKIRVIHTSAGSARPERARMSDPVQPGDQIVVGARIF